MNAFSSISDQEVKDIKSKHCWTANGFRVSEHFPARIVKKNQLVDFCEMEPAIRNQTFSWISCLHDTKTHGANDRSVRLQCHNASLYRIALVPAHLFSAWDLRGSGEESKTCSVKPRWITARRSDRICDSLKILLVWNTCVCAPGGDELLPSNTPYARHALQPPHEQNRDKVCASRQRKTTSRLVH